MNESIKPSPLFVAGLLAVVIGGLWLTSVSFRPGGPPTRVATSSPAEPAAGAAPAVAGRAVESPVAARPLHDGASPPGHAMPVGAPMALTSDPDRIRAWAREDPGAAINWLLTAAPGELRDAAIEMVCAEVVTFDPAQAVGLAERYAPGNIPVLENLVHAWAGRDAAAAEAFAVGKTTGELRNRLLGRVALVRAETDPVAAAKLVVEEIAPGEIQAESIISVLHAWADADPPAALRWAQAFPAGELRERALREWERTLSRER